jgi:hypothetical protein
MVQPALEMHSHRIFRAALLAVVGAWDPITVEANCLWLYSFGVTVVVLLSFHIGRAYSGDIRRSVWPCAASVLPMWCAPQHTSIATMQVGAEKATTVSRRMRRRSMVEDMKVRNLSPATQLSNIHAVSKSALILTDRRITSALKRPTHNYFQQFHGIARRRTRRRMWATSTQATALSIVASKSLARRLHRPIQAKVLSTTHRRGSRTKPFAASLR